MLKLMLILLAFFVFLHSRSEFAERKVTPILDSVALRFAASAPADAFYEAAALALRGDPGTQLRRRLLGHLPISAAAIEVPGGLVAFELDEAALFEPNGGAILRERLVLLHRVAGAIVTGNTMQDTYRLVVTTTWPSDNVERVTGRLAALHAVFAEIPVALAHVRFGFGDVPSGRWRFVIRSAMPDAA